jgi:hypothetical protein
MVDKVRTARRLIGIAFGVLKATFRSGRVWGTLKTRMNQVPRRSVAAGSAAGLAGGAAGAYFLDPQNGKRRRQIAIDKLRALARRGAESERKARYGAGVAKGAAAEAAGAGEGSADLPDPELANKVRTMVFRDAESPKGDVSVNAENGIVYLRGEVSSPDEINELEEATRKVRGVRDVVNLLHVPGQPAPTRPEGERAGAAPGS